MPLRIKFYLLKNSRNHQHELASYQTHALQHINSFHINQNLRKQTQIYPSTNQNLRKQTRICENKLKFILIHPPSCQEAFSEKCVYFKNSCKKATNILLCQWQISMFMADIKRVLRQHFLFHLLISFKMCFYRLHILNQFYRSEIYSGSIPSSHICAQHCSREYIRVQPGETHTNTHAHI